MYASSPRQGKGRSADTITPSGSSAMVIESACTPGSAMCTRSSSPASTTSAGGSQFGTPALKNWRCSRSARSITDRASLHIQLEISRDLTGGTWRRPAAESSLVQETLPAQPVTAETERQTELPLFVGGFALLVDRRGGTGKVVEGGVVRGHGVRRNFVVVAGAGDDAGDPP